MGDDGFSDGGAGRGADAGTSISRVEFNNTNRARGSVDNIGKVCVQTCW